MVDAATVRWQDRAHFLAVSAQMMRRFLVDAARACGSGKRGGRSPRFDVNESIDAAAVRSQGDGRTDDALEALTNGEPRSWRCVSSEA
jgi:RNA polymerase sigma-70 factor (ECF subfamily)